MGEKLAVRPMLMSPRSRYAYRAGQRHDPGQSTVLPQPYSGSPGWPPATTISAFAAAPSWQREFERPSSRRRLPASNPHFSTFPVGSSSRPYPLCHSSSLENRIATFSDAPVDTAIDEHGLASRPRAMDAKGFTKDALRTVRYPQFVAGCIAQSLGREGPRGRARIPDDSSQCN
jgi:hypothetical protein